MKTQEEIEQLADKFATSIYGFRNENHNSYLECKRNCIEFYTQCQEDMADKKYTFNQITDAMVMAREINGKETYYKYSMEEIINSLNKQD